MKQAKISATPDDNQRLDRLKKINQNLANFTLSLKNKNNQLRQEIDNAKINNLRKKLNS